MKKDKLMDLVEISFGKVCPLRCTECSNFIQDSEDKRVLSVEELVVNLEALKKINQLPDSVAIAGGEPTLVKDFNSLARICIEYFDNVLLVTNGIYFDRVAEAVVRNITTRVSIYPINLKLIQLFEKIRDEKGLKIDFRDMPWTISHKTGPHSKEISQQLYDACNLRKHPMMYNDKLWQCCYGFGGDEVKSVVLDDSLTYEALKNMIKGKYFVERCRTCSYADMTPVETAKQPEKYVDKANSIISKAIEKIANKYGV